jgi:hypothetical protein
MSLYGIGVGTGSTLGSGMIDRPGAIVPGPGTYVGAEL